MLVMKFGGTSVSSKQSILTICELVKQNSAKEPVVVVSALSKVTDMLVFACNKDNFSNIDNILADIYDKHNNLAHEVLDQGRLHEVMNFVKSGLVEIKQLLIEYFAGNVKYFSFFAFQDKIVFYGEKMSSFLISSAINQHSRIEARQILSSSCIVTNKKYGSADYIKLATRRNTRKVLIPLIKQKIVPVVTGFVGATHDGDITTLGRGGSDYSASILGYALDASEIQIWTDVNGVYTTDPRKVKSAKILPLLAYEEASELANLGAKVLHPRTIKPAILAKIPVKVLNTFNPHSPGTTIVSKIDNISYKVRAITSRESVPLITIKSNEMLFGKGFLKKVFTIFAKCNISVSLLSVSEVSVSITLDNIENLEAALIHLAKLGVVAYEQEYGSLSLVGLQIMNTPHIMPDIFKLLDQADIKVHMLSYSASNINISMVVLSTDVNRALELLHGYFIGADK